MSNGEMYCCVADLMFPASWFDAVDDAAKKARAKTGKPLPFRAAAAPVALAGEQVGMEGIALGALQARLKWPGNGGKVTVGFLDGSPGLIKK